MEKAIEEGEMEEAIEGDCKEERSRINVSVFKIKRGERKEVWGEHTPDKCMTNAKEGGW